MISYRFMGMKMSGLGTGNHAENKEHVFEQYLMAPENMMMQMHMLMGMYGITDRLTAMLMLNYQVNDMEMSMYAMNHVHPGSTMSSPIHTMKTNGLGDTKVHALYGFVMENTCQLFGTLGVSIPTGSIHERSAKSDPMYSGTLYPYGMQLGSGSLEILPGISYLHQKNLLALGITVSGTYRTHTNSLGYKLGNEANLNSWLAYQWIGWISSTIRVEGTIADHIQGLNPEVYAYREPSTNPINYGGKRINAYLGSSLHLKGVLKNNRLGVEYGLPLYQDINGIQLKQQFALNAFWSFTF